MTGPDPAVFRRLVDTFTQVTAPPLVQEIRLHLATEITPLWQATEQQLADLGLPPPFWAFCWPGGQALARYLLDRPDLVRNKRVLDFACGGGVVAIAVALAGGAAWACDVDPFAIAALGLNSELNGVAVQGICHDPTMRPDEILPGDPALILAGDVFYEKAMSDRSLAWLKTQAAAGATVLIGDPGRGYLPQSAVVPEVSFDIPTSRELEDSDIRRTTVWRLKAGVEG